VLRESALLLGAGIEGPVPEGDVGVPIGEAAIARTGRDVTIVSYSFGLVLALEAAKDLESRGVSAEVVDLRTLRPLDFASVRCSLAKTRRLVVVEEGWPACSIGSEVCARAATECFGLLSAAPVRVSGADVPMPYAANLEALALPTAARIVAAAEGLCYRSPVSSD
jgi:pyruvate dehydrogenase E1 component beta subunit